MTRPQARAGWWASTVGALVAIVLLVLATVGASVWLSVVYDRRVAQEALVGQAHQAALFVRGRMVDTEQVLLLQGFQYAGTSRRFDQDMQALIRGNPALMRVELRTREGRILRSVDPPSPRASLPGFLRTPPSPELAQALASTSALNRLTYSEPYELGAGESTLTVLDLVVPTGEDTGPLIVAVYALQRIIDHFIPVELLANHQYSLEHADGRTLAFQSVPSTPLAGYSARSPLARNGPQLLIRAQTIRAETGSVAYATTGLVALISVLLGVAILFLIRDMHRRTTAERALREQVAFRLAIEDAMLDALAVIDLDGRYVHVNDALLRMTRLEPGHVLGRRRPPFVTTRALRDERRFRSRLASDEGRLTSFETVLQRADGERFPVRMVETAIRDAAGTQTGWLVLASDLTEQHRTEELARRQQEVLQSRSRLATLGEMASTLSHEINQPLAAITSYAAACENLVAGDQPGAHTGSLRRALQGIKAQAERAGQVIRSVHAFLRRRRNERTAVALSAIVQGIEPLIQLQAARTGARLITRIPEDLIVCVDRIMLEQVLLNLTRNGFDAMAESPRREQILEIQAQRVATDERGDRIEVQVIDRGRGVSPDLVSQLFSPFFTTKNDGMGLGLSLCRSVIEQHGGQIYYRARPEAGSIFGFDLPLAFITDAPVESQATATPDLPPLQPDLPSAAPDLPIPVPERRPELPAALRPDRASSSSTPAEENLRT